jgi:DNA repair exonuclease SbcCD ATPase subunit
MADNDHSEDFDSFHDKLLGLGKRSLRKSYYPELQKRIAELEKTQEDLKKYKEHLEELVGERTNELKMTNEQLQQEITERKHAEEERETLILELRDALSKIKTLSGMLPICSSCKKIRDDKGYWNQIESYIKSHSEAEFSHSICPECAKNIYPDFYKYMYPELDK